MRRRRLDHPLGLAAEALRVARSQPVATAVIALLVGATCATILATTGSTLVAEQRVIAGIDAAGTRTITLTDQGGAQLDAAAVARIGSLADVDWAIGLGPVSDARPLPLPTDGTPVPSRYLHGPLPPDAVEVTRSTAEPGIALVTTDAQRRLGLDQPLGAARRMDGRGLPIRGTVAVTGPLADLDGTILVPAGPHDPTDLARIVVLASDVAVVERLLPLLGELAAPADPQALSVTAASELVDVRAAVAGELGRFARQLLAIVLGAGLALTSIAVFGFTSLRRRELGRRRALGATRGHLVALVVTQTALVGAAGSTVGAIGATALLGDQLSPSFTVAIAVLTAGATIVAAVPPALAAAWRDPVTVLRQP